MSEGAERESTVEEHESWAHTAEGPEGPRVHSLREHLEGTAALARRFASAWGAADWGALAGRWHDLGKYSRAFQRYIRESSGVERRDAHIEESDDEPAASRPTRVDHSTAGAQHAQRWTEDQNIKLRELSTKLSPLAFVIAGHHAGLANAEDLVERLKQRGEWLLREALENAESAVLDVRSISEPSLPPLARESNATAGAKQRSFELVVRRRWEFWTRMLFSALVDADFLDTEQFFDPERSAMRGSPTSIDALAERLRAYLDRLECDARSEGDRDVLRVRRAVRAACIDRASMPPGFFTLSVPTGGGKTLASLTFALEHARRHGLERVIVAIPYTSITEQTADAYRAALGGEDGVVVEHHSAFDESRLARSKPNASRRALFRENAWNRLSAENWDAPVIVTTTVQLFESLFANRSSQCRKLHRLARSVIVLDEAQTVPVGYLTPILDVLQTLARDYGSSVVICTATQPAWGPEVLGDAGISAMREIYEDRSSFEALRRVKVSWPEQDQRLSYESLAREIAARDDVLAIVHRRADAQRLCTLVDALVGDESTIHLSALMCGEHRRAVLREVRAKKAAGERVRLVATQLVEAGVDLDFAVVFRAMAGIDALAQAAGRCNREGRLGREGGELRVFLAETDPPPGVLQRALDVTKTMLAARAGRAPLDLFDVDSYREFFSRYYRAEGPSGLDAEGVQVLREQWRFRAVAESVRIIDEWAVPVVVPFGDAPTIVRELEGFVERSQPPPARLLRRLQGFSVNVPLRRVEEWARAGSVRVVNESVFVIAEIFRRAYDARFGLFEERVGSVAIEDTIV